MFQFAVCVFVTAFAVGKADDKLISKGSWRIIVIDQCDEPDKYNMKCNITKYKVSRLEDAFDAGCSLSKDLDMTFTFEAYIKKYAEGWKDYQVIKDNCFLCFAEKYAQENFKHLKEEMGLDRDQDKIPKGEYTIERYMLNYCELPPDGIPGTFRVKALALNSLAIPQGCIMLTMEFREEMDECDDKEAE